LRPFLIGRFEKKEARGREHSESPYNVDDIGLVGVVVDMLVEG